MDALDIGTLQSLRVTACDAEGVWLDGGERRLFLPSADAPSDVKVGDRVEVFIYADREGQPRATTAKPAAMLGEVAVLTCVAVTRGGAYLDWGMPKDLFVPAKEQDVPLVQGRRYVAAVCLDHRGERLIASTRVARHLDYDTPALEIGDEIEALVFGYIDAGVQVVVNRRYRGLVHRAQVHREMPLGSSHVGWVTHIRDDNRIDVELERRGALGSSDAQKVILAALERAGGALDLHDKSSPELIKERLGLSKKAFKRAAGGLYRQRRIVIDDEGIRLLDDDAT